MTAGRCLEIFEKTKGLHKNLRYHFICGLNPAKVTPAIASVIADKQVAEAHFEEAEAGQGLDVQVYHKVRAYLREAGMKDAGQPPERVRVDRPTGRPVGADRSCEASRCSMQLEGLIFKPFTPDPRESGAPRKRGLLGRDPAP